MIVRNRPRRSAVYSFIITPDRSLMAHAHGQFIWHELITSDVDGAKAFYSRITPWGTRPHEGSTYTMWTSASTPIGGLLALEPDLVSRGVPAHWLPYVSSLRRRRDRAPGPVTRREGADAAEGDFYRRRVGRDRRSAGGRARHLFEPQAKGPSSMKTDQRGDFSWHELMTTDSSSALDFYRTLFDWRSAGESDMGEMGTYRMFGQSGCSPDLRRNVQPAAQRADAELVVVYPRRRRR